MAWFEGIGTAVAGGISRALTLWGIRSDEISCPGHSVNGHFVLSVAIAI